MIYTRRCCHNILMWQTHLGKHFPRFTFYLILILHLSLSQGKQGVKELLCVFQFKSLCVCLCVCVCAFACEWVIRTGPSVVKPISFVKQLSVEQLNKSRSSCTERCMLHFKSQRWGNVCLMTSQKYYVIVQKTSTTFIWYNKGNSRFFTCYAGLSLITRITNTFRILSQFFLPTFCYINLCSFQEWLIYCQHLASGNNFWVFHEIK